MYTLSLLSLALATSSLVSSAALKPRNIGLDEVLVFGAGGRQEIVKMADYQYVLLRIFFFFFFWHRSFKHFALAFSLF